MAPGIKRLLWCLAPAAVKEYVLKLDRRIGSLELVLDTMLQSPRYAGSQEAGFNGQAVRKQIFGELLRRVGAEVIVETGTFLGETTGYMAETTGLPVYSVEREPRYHALARMRLAGVPNVHLHLADTRDFLARLAAGGEVAGTVFFYLDAHAPAHLPIDEEIDTIMQGWEQPVLMIDDFEVPGDPGYGFDRHGGDTALRLDYLDPILRRHQLVPFFPAEPSTSETGRRRGCVVLVRENDLCDRLTEVPSLRRAPDY